MTGLVSHSQRAAEVALSPDRLPPEPALYRAGSATAFPWGSYLFLLGEAVLQILHSSLFLLDGLLRFLFLIGDAALGNLEAGDMWIEDVRTRERGRRVRSLLKPVSRGLGASAQGPACPWGER